MKKVTAKKRPPIRRDGGPLWLKKKGYTHIANGLAFDPKTKKWIGYSHRASCAFGIGDKIFDPSFVKKSADMDKMPFVKRGSKTIKTDGDAQLAAKRFSEYVS